MNVLASLPRASPVEAGIVDWPYGWYVVGCSRDLRAGQVHAAKVAGRECVLYRTRSGALHALDAHCPHMGAHLRHGSVVGEQLRCALHGYLIDGAGTVRGNHLGCARARTWPVAERFGLLFVHFGPGEPPPLPAPDGADGFAWTSARPVSVDADWRCLATNAFDMPHLCAVHRRQLVAPVHAANEGGRAWLRYESRVTGNGPSDLLMKLLSRDRIRVRMSCVGTVVLAETDLGFTRTAAVLGMLPQRQAVRAFGAFGVMPGIGLGLRLHLARYLFTAFLRRDFRVVEGMVLRIDDRDPGLRVLFDHLRGLQGVHD